MVSGEEFGSSERPPLVSYVLLFYLLLSCFNPFVYERYYYFAWPLVLLLLPRDVSGNRTLLIFVLVNSGRNQYILCKTDVGVPQMKIGWIEVLKKVYGETIYTDMAQSVLSKRHHLEIINVGLDQFKNLFLS